MYKQVLQSKKCLQLAKINIPDTTLNFSILKRLTLRKRNLIIFLLDGIASLETMEIGSRLVSLTYDDCD